MGTHAHADGDAGTAAADRPNQRSAHDTARMIVGWCRTMSRDAPPGSIRYVEGWNASLQALATRIKREYGL